MYFRITIPALQDGKKDEAISFVKENVMTSFDDTPGLLSMSAAITGETSGINMAAWESKEAAEAVAEKIQATELGKEVLEANENWDDQSVTYQEAKEEFRAFIETAAQFVVTVSEPGPPNEFANLVTSHEELKTLASLISEDTVELLAGLESSDTGEKRAAALDSFNKNLDQFIKKIEEIVASATSS